MKSRVFSLVLCCASYFAFSQTVTGIVADEKGKPVSSATISLLQTIDSSAVKFTVTNQDGRYKFIGLKKGRYMITATSSGFQKAFSVLFDLNDLPIDLPGIVMVSEKNDLSTITVQANRPFIEFHLDKLVINVEASPTNAGSNVLEVLAKSPTINVDMDENISMNGKQGVLVLLDGKTTYLGAKELATLLKSMPSSSVDQIEIMSTPPAKYDAEGMAGVINIKTKKYRNDGLNGSVSSNVRGSLFHDDGDHDVIPSYQNNLSLNYRKHKINVNLAFGVNIYKGRSVASYNKTYFTDNNVVNGATSFIVKSTFSGNYSPLNFGIDYTIDKKNIVSLSANTIIKSSNERTDNRSAQVWDENGILISNYTSNSMMKGQFNKSAANINWKHSLDSSGQEFSFDADVVRYNFPSDNALVMNYTTSPNSINKTYLNSSIHPGTSITAFKLDYLKPLKQGKIEAGIKSGYVSTDLRNEFYRFNNDNWKTDSSLFSYFSYQENIAALYATLEKHIKKWSFQGGLRLERMHANGNESIKQYRFKRKNTALFPTLFSSYEINKNNTLKVSYNRRTNRPQFYALMPYLNIVDSLDIWHGNPELKPEFSDRYELTYAFQGKYFITFSYAITKDVIRYIAGQIGTQKATEFFPINIDKYKNLTLTIISPFTVTKWWNISAITNVFNNKYYDLKNGSVSRFYMTLNQNINNSFKLGKSLKGEMVLDYSTRSIDEISETASMLSNFSIGLQKEIFKQKGSLALNCSDPFEWFHYNYKSHFIRMYEIGSYRYPTRSLSLSFTYRFGNVNNQSRQHSTASQEEQSR